MAYYKNLFYEAQSRRDARNTAGVVLVSVGGALAVAGIVLIALAPKIPKEPKRPKHLESFELSELKVSPLFGGDAMGLSLGYRFQRGCHES
jgi:hypothetical protein